MFSFKMRKICHLNLFYQVIPPLYFTVEMSVIIEMLYIHQSTLDKVYNSRGSTHIGLLSTLFSRNKHQQNKIDESVSKYYIYTDHLVETFRIYIIICFYDIERNCVYCKLWEILFWYQKWNFIVVVRELHFWCDSVSMFSFYNAPTVT